MAALTQYAVLQRDTERPAAEQIRRAFRAFSNLTDADAVRLAANARGILLRHLSADEARAFHRALLAEGVAAAVVAENDLRLLPESKALHRVALTGSALAIYDLLGRPRPVEWAELALVAAGAVQRVEVNVPPPVPGQLKFVATPGGNLEHLLARPGKSRTDPQLILELVLAGGAARYELDAAQFPFKYAVDRPEWTTREKFVWLVREISRRAPSAILNRGARDVLDGIQLVRGYPSRQAFLDEMIWLLWDATRRSG